MAGSTCLFSLFFSLWQPIRHHTSQIDNRANSSHSFATQTFAP